MAVGGGAVPRYRFYSFSIERPFLFTVKRSLQFDNSINISTSIQTEENEDLPFGDYMFIANRTFVLKTDVSKITASSLSPKALIIKVPTSTFLGGEELMLESVHFVEFGLKIQGSDMKVLMDQRRSDRERLRAFERAKQFPLPELASTEALKAMLPSLLGPNYEIFSIVAPEIQRKEKCPYSTSLFFHREFFCVSDTLLMGCIPMSDDSDTEEPSTLLGFIGEDRQGGSSYSQLIAGMFVGLSNLGPKAINRKRLFKKALVFGMHREISSKEVVPVKLTVDFTNSEKSVAVGNESVEVTGFIRLIKRLLENPELMAT